MALVDRTIEPVIQRYAVQYPVITITGPRQSGKTTLCRKLFPARPYVNLEALDTRQFAIDDPRGFLGRFPEGAVLDEIQRTPDIPSYIQEIVDQEQWRGLFVLTGSQQFEVSNSINQSLAGRTALVKLLPFDLEEIRSAFPLPDVYSLMYRGFYPRVWDRGLDPTQALRDYFETYVERDLRQLVAIRDLHLFSRFVRLCAGRTGQLLNLSGLANDTGVSQPTARNWLSLLEASYIIFLLQPYHRNIGKRLIKSPKLYFYDVGLATCLLGMENEQQVARDPLLGSLFENMVIAEVLKHRLHRGRPANLYFYRDSRGNEVDLLLARGTVFFPVEIKAGMTVNRDYFKGLQYIERVFPDSSIPAGGAVVYAGKQEQERGRVFVCPFARLENLFARIGEVF